MWLKRLFKINNKINLRLNRIYKYFKKFYPKNKTVYKSSTEYSIDFASSLGSVKISVRKIRTAHADMGLAYSDCTGRVIFEIISDNDKFNVTPMLDDTLSGHDVDLALLELEKFLEITYGDIDKLLIEEEKEYQQRLKRHKKELKILNGDV